MAELWASNFDAYSHRCRIVICEKNAGLDKGIGVSVKNIDTNSKPTELARLNPLNRVPVLVDNELVLYESAIIDEYIDDHYPHPQLMPPSVKDKAKARLMMFEYDLELYSRMDRILESRQQKVIEANRRELADALLQLTLRMGKTKYLAGNEFSMPDVHLAPLLWRLEILGIKLPPKAAPLLKYAEIVFSRPSFISSLTPTEKQMRK